MSSFIRRLMMAQEEKTDMNDGKYQFVSEYSKSFLSTDYGNSFKQINLSVKSPIVSICKNGKYCIIASELNCYLSSDFLKTFNKITSITSAAVSSISSDGKYQTIGTYDGYLYSSNNYGKTFVQNSISNAGLSGLNMSGDGKYQTVSTVSGGTYISKDYGKSWVESKDVSGTAHSSAISDNGKYQIISTIDKGLYISSDYGETWNTHKEFGYSSDMSSDGKVIVTTSNNGNELYISKDSWKTFKKVKEASSYIQWVSVSSTGKYQLYLFDDAVYQSCDYGETIENKIIQGYEPGNCYSSCINK